MNAVPILHRPVIEWTDQLLVGNEMIDADHRQLFALARQISAGLLQTQDIEALASVLDQLMNYTREHFAREEALMKEIGYPGRDEHMVEHRLLNYHLRNLHYRFQSGERHLAEDIEIFLDRWLARHILTADLQLARDLNGQCEPPRLAAGMR